MPKLYWKNELSAMLKSHAVIKKKQLDHVNGRF